MPIEIYRTDAPIATRTTTKIETKDNRSLGDKAKDVFHDVKDAVTGESHVTRKDVAKAQKKEMKMRDKEEKYEAKAAHLERKREEQQARKCRQHGVCPSGCANEAVVTRITEIH